MRYIQTNKSSQDLSGCLRCSPEFISLNQHAILSTSKDRLFERRRMLLALINLSGMHNSAPFRRLKSTLQEVILPYSENCGLFIEMLGINGLYCLFFVYRRNQDCSFHFFVTRKQFIDIEVESQWRMRVEYGLQSNLETSTHTG